MDDFERELEKIAREDQQAQKQHQFKPKGGNRTMSNRGTDSTRKIVVIIGFAMLAILIFGAVLMPEGFGSMRIGGGGSEIQGIQTYQNLSFDVNGDGIADMVTYAEVILGNPPPQ